MNHTKKLQWWVDGTVDDIGVEREAYMSVCLCACRYICIYLSIE